MFLRTVGDSQVYQVPQGGIEPGEDHQMAALRELKEETCITSVEPLMTLSSGIKYDFPPEVLHKFQAMGRQNIGQEQFWTLAYFYGPEAEIDPAHAVDKELGSYQWVPLDQVVDLAWEHKRNSYKMAVKEFTPVIEKYVAQL